MSWRSTLESASPSGRTAPDSSVVLDDERIEEAIRFSKETPGMENLIGQTFLDAGSGSGLSNLAARRLGHACIPSTSIRIQ